jgi:hypothetical protein
MKMKVVRIVCLAVAIVVLGCAQSTQPRQNRGETGLGVEAAAGARASGGTERRCNPDVNPDCPIGPPPRDPPSSPTSTGDCVSRVGDYAWSCHGPVDGYRCTQILEASDPDTWSDNYLCAKDDTQFTWSLAGKVAGLACLQITEPSEPPAHTWTDNYLCTQKSPRWRFYWSFAGPLQGKQCLRWLEPSDPHTWSDNYLCFDDRFFDGDTNGNPNTGTVH